MDANKNSPRLHPLIATAAGAVLLASLVGIAAMTGILPNSNSANAQKEAIIALEKEAAAKEAEAKAAEEKATLARKDAEERQAAEEKAALARKEDDEHRAAEEKAQLARKAANDRQVAANKAAAKREADAKVAQAQICYDCGTIESVRAVQTQAKASGVGVVGGAVVGGLLGNQIGKGKGKSLATVAGAVGGGFAGNEIEKRTQTTTTYQVRVRMEDGKIRTFPYNNQPNWNQGDRVRVVDGYLRAR